MKREQVYKALDTEREYQDNATADDARSDMVDNFSLGQAILAMEELLLRARLEWYHDTPQDNYQNTMQQLRKVTGVGVMMGEKYGMPERK